MARHPSRVLRLNLQDPFFLSYSTHLTGNKVPKNWDKGDRYRSRKKRRYRRTIEQERKAGQKTKARKKRGIDFVPQENL